MMKKSKSVFAIIILMSFLVTCLFAPTSVCAADSSPALPNYNNDLLYERTFNSGLCYPWHSVEDSGGLCSFDVVDVPGETGNKAFALKVLNKGQNAWSVQMRHRGIVMEKGHTYRVQFKVWADASCQVYAKIGTMGDPYTEFWNNKWSAFPVTAGKVVTVDQTFTVTGATTKACEFAFHVGGKYAAASTPYTVYLDDVSLYDADFQKPVVEVMRQPNVRVNQLGYFADGVKHATAVCSSTTPIQWKLVNAAGVEVKNGLTQVKGLDKDSQDFVHIIDFTDFKVKGLGYKFLLPTVNSITNYSHPFDIRDDLYSQMKLDALSYFYHNRSGIEIKMPYAGREDLCRPAGHIGVAPNKGDKAVATWPESGQKSYSLDVTGGWYDAGDHGKYVVNGGISVWTMLNQYERAKLSGLDKVAPYKDGGMNIPENANGIPDILDEAKWEMDFLMKMQVPEDKDPALAGMVHHKMHDQAWTALGLLPHQDPQTRLLRPVSTAATLNLAAAAAQSARIFKGIDDVYAAKCLESAEKAWEAAKKHPDMYAPNHSVGGGPYNDNNVLDEFYWAACELFITTGKAEYKDYLMSSKHYLEMPSSLGEGEDIGLIAAFTWGNTQGLGTLSLALVPNSLPEAEIEKARSNMAAAADVWLGIIKEQGYGLPIKQGGANGGYPWGSNSFIVNIMMVLGCVYDFTEDTKYLDGMRESMDYLMGRNALDQNYVSGYGERPLLNPHHRFWTPQTSDEFPRAPAGCFSGGPNSHFQDPTINAAMPKDTPVQKCFIDHTDSWSTNEITINWNAPFAWVAAFLDEKAGLDRVSIDTPAPGAKYEAGKDINISASVKTMSSVTKVEFYNGTKLISADTTAPYTGTITSAAAGNYNLIAKAYLTDGKTIDSPVVPVLAKVIVKPTVKLTAPGADLICYGNELAKMTASASDSDGKIAKVEFLVDGKVVGTDKEAPYEYDWKSVEGPHILSAIAYDDDDASASSNTVTVTIKPAKDVVVQYMCDGATVSTQEIKGKFNLFNKGQKEISLKDLTVRYYFTPESTAGYDFTCYYAQIGSGNLVPSFGGEGEGYYMQLNFKDVKLAAGGETGQMQFVIRTKDNSMHNQQNDYSFEPTYTALKNFEKVTLYKNGELVWGKEPGTPAQNFKISGYVSPDFITDTAPSLVKAGFKVEVDGTSLSAVTDESGYFAIANVPAKPAGYNLKISKTGYFDNAARIPSFTKDVEVSTANSPIVLVVGDINQDGAVNMSDIMEVAKAFNSVSGDSRYEASLDINQDGAVNMSDIMTVARNFNKTVLAVQ